MTIRCLKNRPIRWPRTCLALAVLFGGEVRAQEPCAPYIEEHPNAQTVSFRPHTNAFASCPVAESEYSRVLKDWLEHRHTIANPLKTIAMGRVVAYPWISEYLARTALASLQWDAVHGKPRQGNINAMAARLLSDAPFIRRLQRPLDGTYAIRSVSVEKVLVGPFDGVVPDRKQGHLLVPFDAQLWLVVEPSRPSDSHD